MAEDVSATPQELVRQPVKYPTVPEPSADPSSLREAVVRLKEGYEMLTGQRGPNEYSMVEGLTIIQKRLGGSTARMYELNRLVVEANLALAERTQLIEAEITNARGGNTTLTARITQVDQARVTGDAALASSITTVEAKANDATASGQVRLVARNTPLGGQSATYDVELTANGAKAGLHIGAVGGDSVFAISANKFFLYDPSMPSGIPLPVLTYSTGKFVFTGDVAINGNLIIDDTVATEKIELDAVTNSASNSAITTSGNDLSVVLTTRANAKVLIVASLTNITSGVSNDGSNPNSTTTYGFDVKVDGTAVKSLFSVKTVVQVQSLGGGGYNYYRAPTPVTDHITVSGLSAGAHTFAITNSAGSNMGLALSVVEMAR